MNQMCIARIIPEVRYLLHASIIRSIKSTSMLMFVAFTLRNVIPGARYVGYIYMQICHTIHVVRMYVRPSAKPRFSRLCVFRKASAFFRFCDSMADSNYYSHVHTEKARKGQVLRIQPSKIRNTGRKKKAARTHPSFQAKEARKTKQEASAPSSMWSFPFVCSKYTSRLAPSVYYVTSKMDIDWRSSDICCIRILLLLYEYNPKGSWRRPHEYSNKQQAW